MRNAIGTGQIADNNHLTSQSALGRSAVTANKSALTSEVITAGKELIKPLTTSKALQLAARTLNPLLAALSFLARIPFQGLSSEVC